MCRTLSVMLLAGGIFLLAHATASTRTLSRTDVQRVFADIDNAVSLTEIPGPPSVTELRRDGSLIGYAFTTREVVGSVGYSGKPIDILVGLAIDGTLTGAHLLSHSEPILVIGVSPERLSRFVAGFAGYDVRETATPGTGALPDIVTGASVSSAVISDAIVRAARSVAAQQRLFGTEADSRRLDRSSFSSASWSDLLNEGAIVKRIITNRDLADSLPRTEGTSANPDGTFIELFVGLATPPRVGQNLIGQRDFNRLIAETGPDDSTIFIAANGRYSFKGTSYRKTGTFERIQVVQGARTIKLTRQHYQNVQSFDTAGAPEMRETGLFTLPHDTGFDPLAPWRLELSVGRETAAGGALSALFSITYALPEPYILGNVVPSGSSADAAAPPLWETIWLARKADIAILCIILLALTAILVFQNSVVRNARRYQTIRLGFLIVTVVWIGWIAGAQLSVVNIITFAQSLLTGFSWNLFLLDPLVFMLWGFTAVALLFWGRGVFCGWLCPFGALQELLNEAARRLHLPQIKVPFALHERLWPIKYVIFLGLFAISLGSVELAFQGAEVEPFKTVISMKFMREWPFVAFALALLGAGLFIERFYCRYVCPLGAALAIPARLHMFEWLKRRPQCGSECRVCEVRCTVQAIHPDGAINPNECIHCLSCQRFYHDKTMCPPLIVKEKRRLKREAVAARDIVQESSK